MGSELHEAAAQDSPARPPRTMAESSCAHRDESQQLK